MQTEVLSERDNTLDEIAEKCTAIWLAGGLAAFPTETVYGLGGNGLDPEAAKKIYAAKGRPSDNPLILHIGERSQLAPLVKDIPEAAEKLMDAFWPGPLTMILNKSDAVPFETSGGLNTVAIRMPSHRIANALLRKCPVPIAAPSANLSGRPSPTTAKHVIEDMNRRIELIVDGGESDIGVESTIIDLTGSIPVLLRPGYITLEKLKSVVGQVNVDPAITAESIINHTNAVAHPKAPGMKYRHYAPKAPVTIIAGDPDNVIRAINAKADENTGIIASAEHSAQYRTGKVEVIGSIKDPESIAHHLFDVLRSFDELNVAKIYSEDFTDADIGTAVMNRLLKAAGGCYLSAEEFLNRQEL